MLKAFYQIDLFGKAVLFNYRGHSKSKSHVGAIFTILLFVFIVWLVYDFSLDLIYKTDPRATTSESFNDDPSPVPLNANTFAFAIAISNPYTFANYMNESIFTVNAYTYKTTRVPQPDGTVNIIYENLPLDLEPCRADHFGELANKFSFVALDQMYCIKEQQQYINTTYPILEGNFESPVYQSIAMEFKVCDNVTSTVPCGTQDEINNLIEGGFVSLSFSNIAVDLTDNQKPIKPYRDSFYTTVGTSFNKGLTMYLQQMEINTDAGWLTTDYKTENYVKYDHINEIFGPVSQNYFLYFNIRLGNVMKHYNRSYIKVQDIIARVNGLIAVAFTVLFILLAPYVRLKFYEALINEIFDIKLSKGKSKEKKTKGKSKEKKSSIRSIELKNTAKSLAKEEICSSQEDLETQKPPSKSRNNIILNNILPNKKRNANNQKKNQALEEPFPAQHDLTDFMQSPVGVRNKEVLVPQETETHNLRIKLGDSEFRLQSEMQLTSPLSQSGSKPGITLEIPSQLYSPTDLKRELSSSSRRPAFKKFHMKSLDYEDDGQDFVEDLLKNMQEDQANHNNATPMDEQATSVIKSEEKENEDLNIKTMKGGTYYTTEVWPPETNNEEKEHKDEEINDDKEMPHNSDQQNLQSIASKKSDKINLSFWEYIRSKFSRSEVIKEKMYIINEGIERINERLDIFNLFKKLREFDKLKMLLMESEQLVLFYSLPKPELVLKASDVASNSNLHSRHTIKDAQFIQEKKKKDLIMEYYYRLKHKEAQSALDKKLINIYEDIFYIGSKSLD